MKGMKQLGIAAGLLLAASLPVAADDFGLSYDVERVPATVSRRGGCP